MMKPTFLLSIAALATIAVAIPAPSFPRIATSRVLTTFDENQNSSSIIQEQVPTVPGQFRFLNWTSFYPSFPYGNGPDCFITCPHSLYWRVSAGGRQYPPGTPGTGTVSSVYNGSRLIDWAPRSFWFSCSATRNLTAEGLVPIPDNLRYLYPDGYVAEQPANCTLTIKGYILSPKSGFGPIATQSFVYDPDNYNLRPSRVVGNFAFDADMMFVNVSNAFSHVRYVTFDTAPGFNAIDLPRVYLDDFTYDIRNLTMRS